jgi:hypothetical protein
MRVPPIVARELRVAARGSTNYWMRAVIAAAAVAMGVVIFLIDVSAGVPQRELGRPIFLGLSWLMMFYCLAAGRRWTVDCLSEEKREGTLGLLFLTDLRGYDVVLGKLAATSLGGLYALLAVVPVLAIPLLLGGVGNGEFWRTVLVLVDTFLLSMSLGIFCSAISREHRRAAVVNFLLLLLIVMGLPLLAMSILVLAGATGPSEAAFAGSPFFALYFAGNKLYQADAPDYWLSVGIIFALSLLFVAAASWIVPRAWQDRGQPAEKAVGGGFWHWWSYGDTDGQAAFRKQALDVNAFYWLVARARRRPFHTWLFLLAMFGWWLWIGLTAGPTIFEETTSLTLAILVNTTFKLWIALEASQRLADDRKAGCLEALLTVPLTTTDFLRGQFLALRRQFLLPLLTAIAVELILAATGSGFYSASRTEVLTIAAAGTFILVADMAALGVVAMRSALTARSPSRAVLGAVTKIIILPWVLICTVLLAISGWQALTYAPPSAPSWRFLLTLWFGFGLLADVVFGLTALSQLAHRFREIATRVHTPRFARGPKAAVSAEPMPLPPPEEVPLKPQHRWRRPVLLTGAGLIVAGAAAMIFFRDASPKYPPPPVATINQSSGPVGVFPCQGAFILLPDGSLWRWGAAGGTALPRAVTPERIGTNSDWSEAGAQGDGMIALRTDGTLWESGHNTNILLDPHAPPGDELHRAGTGHDWVQVSSLYGSSVAIRRDGTLWDWGLMELYGKGAIQATNHAGLVRVGSDNDWLSARALQMGAVGLRRNGTLWAWGWFPRFARPGSSAVNFIQVPDPTRLCCETNWTSIEFAIGNAVCVRNAAGELWEIRTDLPINPEAYVAAFGRLLVTNSAPQSAAVATTSFHEAWLYDIRADGTLWKTPFAWNLAAMKTPAVWQQAGRRTDWVWLCGGWGTAYGLTSDGTLWTWGCDYSKPPVVRQRAASSPLQSLIQRWTSPSTMNTYSESVPPFQTEPRPLMRIMAVDANDTTAPGGN